MNFFEFQAKFPTEEAVISHFIKVRYGEGKVPRRHCRCISKVYHQSQEPKKFNCRNCNNTFSIFKNTIFEDSCTEDTE